MTRFRCELRTVMLPGLLILPVLFLLGWLSSQGAERSSLDIAFRTMLWGATAFGLGIAFLPSPFTDRCWEVTRVAADPEGHREGRVLLFLIGLTLLLLAGVCWVQQSPLLLLEWAIPRMWWFGSLAGVAFLLTRNVPLCTGLVVVMFILPYCPMPPAINPLQFQEPRVGVHVLCAVLGLLTPLFWKGYRPALGRRLLVGVLLASLSLFPVWRLMWPVQMQTVTAPAQWTEGTLVVLQSPWGTLQSKDLDLWTERARLQNQEMVVLQAHGGKTVDPDLQGTQLAQNLGLRAFPAVLQVTDGQVRLLELPGKGW